ncbi:hypothetical protein BZA77DRAFT_108760 [Pyronema omphalodes]|nr:hypothetical protein BZA77DRAFT_108760 [Pyronema omphalodes]
MRSTTSILCAALMAGCAFAEVSFSSTDKDYDFEGQVKATLSKDCATAYSQKVSCSPLLLQLRDDNKGPALLNSKNLKDMCTTECIDSLNAWDKAVNKACTSEDKKAIMLEDDNAEYLQLALNGAHQIQESLYWTFCLQDEAKSDFCILRNNLPAFPEDPKEVPDFCGSSCRTQQAQLITQIAKDAGSKTKIYDPKNCPNVDVSSFRMNSITLKAFGASEPTAFVEENDDNDIPGTGYEFDIYTSDAIKAVASKTKAEDATTSGSAAASASATGGAGVNAASILGAGVAAMAAFFMC